MSCFLIALYTTVLMYMENMTNGVNDVNGFKFSLSKF